MQVGNFLCALLRRPAYKAAQKGMDPRQRPPCATTDAEPGTTVPDVPLPGFARVEDDALSALVDLDRYPIHRLDSDAGQKLIAECRYAWATKGSVSLPGFIRERVREPMFREVSDLPAFRRLYTASAYAKGFEDVGNHFPESHPAMRQLQMDIHAVAGDLVPPNLMLRQLYDSPQLARFFARVLSLEQEHVYQYADPWQCLNVRTSTLSNFARALRPPPA